MTGPPRAGESEQRRIEALITALEALEDPRAREPAKALLQIVLELHARGLARLMEIVSQGGAAGEATIEAMMQDPQVSALLLLHGQHPRDLPSRARHAVEKMRASLGTRGIAIELIDANEEAVRVKLSASSRARRESAATLRREIEDAIFELAPELTRIDIDGLPDDTVQEIRFVATAPQRRSRAAVDG